MNSKLHELDELMARSAPLIAEVGYKTTRDDTDGSWYFSPSGDHYRHVHVRDGAFVLGQVDRDRPERDEFVSSNARDMELFIAFWLCGIWRSARRLPMLTTVAVPATVDKAAPGFAIERDGTTWVLTGGDSGAKRWSDDFTELVLLSYYVAMTPDEVRDACMAPDGKPPFFPLA